MASSNEGRPQKKKKITIEPGKLFFRPQFFWQEVLPEHVLDVPWLEKGKLVDDEKRTFAREQNATFPALGDTLTQVNASELLADNDPKIIAAAVCVDEAREDEASVAKIVRSVCTWGDLAKLRRLLTSAFVPPRACDGAMCEAARLGHREVVEDLLRAGASAVACDKGTAKTALHFACMQGHEDLAMLLVDAKGDLLAKDVAGMTPCQLAREQDFGMMAKRLEKHTTDAFRHWLAGKEKVSAPKAWV
jgi:hypothetical protein